jgi:hypothetical protein
MKNNNLGARTGKLAIPRYSLENIMKSQQKSGQHMAFGGDIGGGRFKVKKPCQTKRKHKIYALIFKSTQSKGNRMNAFIMVRERLLFRSSPDKGRTGGVCSAKIGFLHDLSPQTPSIPPCQGGSGQISASLHPAVASYKGQANLMAFMRLP